MTARTICLVARITPRGLIKPVADSDGGKLLGAHTPWHLKAPTSPTAAITIHCELTVRQLAEMIVPYLTTVDGLKLAAQSFTKKRGSTFMCAGRV